MEDSLIGVLIGIICDIYVSLEVEDVNFAPVKYTFTSDHKPPGYASQPFLSPKSTI